MRIRELCAQRCRRKVRAYWTDLEICPSCCITTAARFDREGWPATPWKEWPQ